MRKIKKFKRGNNKGVSLVELLIALVVGTIVISALTMLLTQGLKEYNKLTITTQLQEDANIALNNISNSIMEANYVVISNSKTDATFQTGSATKGGDNVIYMLKDGCLYLGTNTADMESMGLLCKNVEEFKVDVVSTSLRSELATDEADASIKHKITGINNPVQIKVTIKLSFNGVTREVSRVASVRNRLSAADITMQGFLFSSAPYMEQFDAYIAYD